jgi:rhodanese-related sulfurtransferase
MQVNAAFADELVKAGIPKESTLLFICRSGARSRSAAIAMTQAGFRTCYNVAGGFEGPPDGERHRGKVDGWKAKGLPWVQG